MISSLTADLRGKGALRAEDRLLLNMRPILTELPAVVANLPMVQAAQVLVRAQPVPLLTAPPEPPDTPSPTSYASWADYLAATTQAQRPIGVC